MYDQQKNPAIGLICIGAKSFFVCTPFVASLSLSLFLSIFVYVPIILTTNVSH